MEKLEEIFIRIQKAGLRINANKSFFARPELEYLGYWITRRGIQPIAKKVQAIQNIACTFLAMKDLKDMASRDEDTRETPVRE